MAAVVMKETEETYDLFIGTWVEIHGQTVTDRYESYRRLVRNHDFLQAAVMLVPDDWEYLVRTDKRYGGFANCTRRDTYWSRDDVTHQEEIGTRNPTFARTPALALLGACRRAHQLMSS